MNLQQIEINILNIKDKLKENPFVFMSIQNLILQTIKNIISNSIKNLNKNEKKRNIFNMVKSAEEMIILVINSIWLIIIEDNNENNSNEEEILFKEEILEQVKENEISNILNILKSNIKEKKRIVLEEIIDYKITKKIDFFLKEIISKLSIIYNIKAFLIFEKEKISLTTITLIKGIMVRNSIMEKYKGEYEHSIMIINLSVCFFYLEKYTDSIKLIQKSIIFLEELEVYLTIKSDIKFIYSISSKLFPFNEIIDYNYFQNMLDLLEKNENKKLKNDRIFLLEYISYSYKFLSKIFLKMKE